MQDDFNMFIIAQKIGIPHINENRLDIMLTNIIGIGFLDAEHVFISDRLFVGPVSFPDIFLQFIHGSMEINDNIRLNKLLIDNFKQFLIKPEFLFRKIDFCKQESFGKQVI
jgi:hypothetical protein